METLVHIRFALILANLCSVTLDLPESVAVTKIRLQDLPDNWHSYPSPIALAEIGARWIKKQEPVAMSVPSAILPKSEDRNYILNPHHPDFHLVTIVRVDPYSYDSRLMS